MNRACPVVLRKNNDRLELLAFKHPEGGNQLVKGNIEKNESLDNACVRELAEESGVKAEVVRHLGVWDANFKDQVWGFCLMHYDGELPDRWDHDTHDDDGHIFSLFWQPLDEPLDGNWNTMYTNAFHYIRDALGK